MNLTIHHLDPLVVIWVGVNMGALILTGMSFTDAVQALIAARSDQEVRHKARELAAFGNARREALRLIVQLLLLSLAVPGLFVTQPIQLTPFLVILIAIPILLLISTLLDTRDRSRLAELLLGDIRAERALLALESSVQENIALTRDAADKADAAYKEANSVNQKIEALGVIVTHKEDKLGESPLDLTSEAVVEQDAQATTEVPITPLDEGSAVDDGRNNASIFPPKLDERTAG